MADHDCSTTMASLLEHLEKGTELRAGVEEEVRGCASCTAVLRRAQRLGALLETENREVSDVAKHDSVTTAVISEVSRRRRNRVMWSAFAVLVASIGFGFYTATHSHLHHPIAVGILDSFFLGGPMLLLMASVRSVSPGKVFKRLEGRQLSGVCSGLAEPLNISPWIIRLIFIVLLFVKGTGLVIYLLLDLVLPIHPADRANLLRFRLARWWKAHVA